ncbi:dihydrodipicolinate reductase [Mycobacterium sp. 94-17]|uniref:NAD(P)H-dependent amine dehydrogenase family protein n=1 Tax=Mycobacterium sp. 94-17 TaxID=2986147 RepID=UPI002D1EBF93|nr:dihydrodipicolinate reductase [Mycobacterium sp. 94-17]MEB4210611.1 dihydrodipicolinate reductase [Mycobacterium sp. 94-17]
MPEARKPIRVAQWTSGIVGASAIRAILDDPRLQLVGLYSHGPDKRGQDAGVLAGRDPVGVTATDDVNTVLASKPDCVVYMPHWPDIAELERILSAGINVVTTARLVNGDHYPDNAGARLRSAAHTGNATLVGTGCNPMHVPTIALAATAMCRHVSRISVTESMDCFLYGNAPTWSGYGFGGRPDIETISAGLRKAEPDYPETVVAMARAIGVEIDDVELTVELAVALSDRDLGFLQIPEGSVAGIDATWTGTRNGEPVTDLRTTWTLGTILGHPQEPEWKLANGYLIDITGDPNIKLKMSFAPADFETFDIGTTTAMPAVNAIPAVVAAPSGVFTPLDLPVITARSPYATVG